MMLHEPLTNDIDEHLDAIARDPTLRGALYGQIGEYFHQCRNRLNSLKLSLYLIKRQADCDLVGPWSEAARQYDELERRMEHLQRLCRPLTLSRVRIGLDLLLNDRQAGWSALWASRHELLRIEPPPSPVVASFDVDRLGHALDRFVAWRAGQGAGSSVACLRWWARSGEVHLSWVESAAAVRFDPANDCEGALPWLIRGDRRAWRPQPKLDSREVGGSIADGRMLIQPVDGLESPPPRDAPP